MSETCPTSGDETKEVRLRCDLSRYHPALVVGAIGRARLPTGKSRKRNPGFVRVSFPDVGCVDVMLSDVEEVALPPKEPSADA